MADLWIDLSRALARLDALSATADSLQDGEDQLPGLQYELHCAAELVAGMAPPEGAEELHEELADAIMEGREATAEIAEALAHGGHDAAAPLVWEWRGALFRVRFARLRLERPRAAAPARASLVAESPRSASFPLTACAVALGSLFVLLAALLGLWLLVGLTLAGTLAASILLHP
jgi:hypothetical protein